MGECSSVSVVWYIQENGYRLIVLGQQLLL